MDVDALYASLASHIITPPNEEYFDLVAWMMGVRVLMLT